MMLNVRATLWRIFGILFIFLITFTAYGQQEQQPAALSQSQFEKILEKIEESEDEMRTHVDKKFDELDKKFDAKFDELDDKFDELDKQVAVLNTKVNILIAIIVGIFTLIVAPILVLMLRDHLNQRNSVEIAAENREKSDEDIKRKNFIDNQHSEAA